MNDAFPWMHKLRLSSVKVNVLAAINEKRSSVTGLGRAIESEASEKHCIKRADRLLSNSNLYGEHRKVYHTMTQIVIGAIRRPLILIDWSDCDDKKAHFILCASLALEGRSIILYEEIHTIETKEKPKTHRTFLERFNKMIAEDCIPILVTDAGFRTPWFREVESLGWDWVGRIRNKHLIKHCNNSEINDWKDCKTYYSQATSTPKYLGRILLTRKTPLECELVIYKGKPKGRIKKTKFGERCQSSHSKKNAAKEKEPWLLASSMKVNSKLAKQVKNSYATRMQIEETFRDVKSARFGLGFELNATYKTKRLVILLMIVMLALFVLWLLGLVAKKTNQHYQYQANTVKNKNVLSVNFIGLRVANDQRGDRSESNTRITCADWEWAELDKKTLVWATQGCLFRASIQSNTKIGMKKMHRLWQSLRCINYPLIYISN